MEALKIYYTSKIAEYFHLTEQVILFPSEAKVCLSSAPTFHVSKFYRRGHNDDIIVTSSYFPELMTKWSGRKKFPRREEKRVSGLELLSSGVNAASRGIFLPTFRDNISVPILLIKKVNVKVKQSHYGPGQAERVLGS